MLQRNKQALIESRVIVINDLIARANVIDVTKIENERKSNIWIYSKGQDLETDKKITYRLVGQDEADIKKNLVFFKSPIGKALIGKNKREVVTVTTPSGERNFEVLGVEYI
jgi:transcription elongation factor GreA